MPQPEGAALQIDVYLTNFAVGIMPGIEDLQGRRLFTNVPMAARIGKYPRWDNFADWNRVEGKELANKEAPPTAGFGKPTTKYVEARKWGVHTDWTDDDLSDADTYAGEFGADVDIGGGADAYELKKVRYVTRMAALRHELDVINLVRNTNWGVTLQGSDSGAPAGSTDGAGGGITGSFLQWDDSAAEPIALMRNIMLTMLYWTGKKPNVATMPTAVLNILYEHPTFLERVVGGANVDRPAAVSKQLLANLLGIDEIIEVSTVINTAKEGLAAVQSWAWGYDVFMCYRPPAGTRPDEENPAPAYNFTWTGRSGGKRPTPFQVAANAEGIFINRYNLQRPATYNAESYLFTSPKVVARQMGILLKDVIPASAAPILGVGTYE